ncbi:hypothetical protein CNYM01_01672 [Colletotrichum nymphaeae SA-01]|uniref:Uncharacterized protein n=1 Tax=Colletotrichum nymphaeae SA-01 TaxID=1460502 RepID=A0A135TWX6_9PEZI|nr:hypothetical protein CNYM01_01672 [Colletotrichum nymphaeae SA-01]
MRPGPKSEPVALIKSNDSCSWHFYFTKEVFVPKIAVRRGVVVAHEEESPVDPWWKPHVVSYSVIMSNACLGIGRYFTRYFFLWFGTLRGYDGVLLFTKGGSSLTQT